MSLLSRIKIALQVFTQKDESKVKGVISMDKKGWKWHHAHLYIDLPAGFTVDECYWSYRAGQTFPVCYMTTPNRLVVTVKKNIEKENG